MNIKLQKSAINNRQSTIKITGSKSETNRLLLLQALYPNITLENVSKSDDSEVMIHALTYNLQPTTYNLIDVHHAGTAMRFLTAYFAILENKEVILTGSSRMKERPIKILVEALRQLGADISYLENEGFPPIKIKGEKITKNKVSLQANVSSQYISALLLIASKLENGLELTLEGEITSIPYINMTLALLNEFGIETTFCDKKINVKPTTYNLQPATYKIESDWSSASYFYSIVALSAIGTQVTIASFKQNSLQGDAALVEIYKDFGVETVFNSNNSITISKVDDNLNGNLKDNGNDNFKGNHNGNEKTSNPKPTTYNLQPKTHNLQPTTYNLNNCPDIAQTIAVTAFGLGLGCHLTGLHTLKIKETDRLEALKNELSKLGAKISVTNDSLTLEPSKELNSNVSIATYQDHRMAMAFAPLALKTSLIIENAEVVSKSYPTFWDDLKKVGFNIDEVIS